MPAVDTHARDRAVDAFRRHVWTSIGFVPFAHQADWSLAAHGWSLTDREPGDGDYYTSILVADPADTTYPAEGRSQHVLTALRALAPRPGGIAHHLANLAAFKGGKSYGGAAHLAGYAILPDAVVYLVGMEYGICEHEFTYLVEMLCSDRGMGMPYTRLLNDARGGRMTLTLKTGARFECKSWERKENLKGAKADCYYYCEAYQFPGLVCYTAIAQNLRERRGRAIWTTTPDTPWVTFLHDRGHGADDDWHCSCGADDRCNPFTFDQAARDRDDPEKGGIMTRERFEIAHNGRIGGFIGRVYQYQRGDKLSSPSLHAGLWRPPTPTRGLSGTL